MLSNTNSRSAAVRMIRPTHLPLEMSTLNPLVLKAEYAVRGEIVSRADAMRKKLAAGEKLPFDSIISCNIGNPFAVGKNRMNFSRQVLSVIENPDLLEDTGIPLEARERAKQFLTDFPAGMGAYTHSQGIEFIRNHVAEFIKKRDGGIPAHPDKIFLTTGASSAVTQILNMLISSPNVGIMTPYPTYPLYTAEIALKNGKVVPYYLKESAQWALDTSELIDSYTVAKKAGIDVKAIVIINPGNPTGSVMPSSQMREVVDFCEQNNILIIADEVYQDNIYNPEKPFVSFKKIVSEMKSSCQLISLHSISKGYMGECGHRGGYMELFHIPDDVKAQFYKLASIGLCSNTDGQVLVDIMCHPPESPECKAEWESQKTGEINRLKEKALRLQKTLNDLPGLSCQPADGAMYLFPQIHLPLKAYEDAKSVRINGNLVPADGAMYLFPQIHLPLKAYEDAKSVRINGNLVPADMFYCLRLLEETGIVVVPGSGFGQVPGTYHFRTTFLPEKEKMDQVIERITKFQNQFMDKYA